MLGNSLIARLGTGMSPGSVQPVFPDAPNAAALLVAPYANAPHDSTVWLTDHLRDFVSVPVGTVDAIPGTGNDWLSLTQPPPAATVADLATMAYANVPRGQSVFVIADGFVWTSVPVGAGLTAGTGNDWRRDIDFADLLNPAVGTLNTVVASNVLGPWTIRVSAADNIWDAVAFGNGLFVAVAENGVNRVMTSPDGITWTARPAAEASSWVAVTFGAGLFVAVAFAGVHRVMTSPDGITWTARTSPIQQWFGVTYGRGLFVATSIDGVGNRVMTSPDGINWTSRVSAQDNTWLGLVYGNGLFVSVAFDGANRVQTSPDGIAWTPRVAAAANGWTDVTYANGLFVAVSGSGVGNRVMTSPDGINWTSRVSPADNAWNGIVFANGLFVAVAGSGAGNRAMTSPDGITWTISASAMNNSWSDVTFANGLFVAVAFTSVGNRVMTARLSEASGNVAQGTVTLNGAVAVNVANIAITAKNLVVLTLSARAGTPGTAPAVVITPGVGFSVTGIALDTSTYFWRII